MPLVQLDVTDTRPASVLRLIGAGFTAKDAAHKVGVNRKTIARWRSGLAGFGEAYNRALLLSHECCGEPWCLDWYWRVHHWSFAHFPDTEHGEWRQRLDRQGDVLDRYIALPVKDPFHLPRAVIYILDVLERLRAAG